MRIIAPMMILIMMTSTLAGCTGGDPDGGGNDNIDMDVLNSLIDDNLQDFVNNTTITVNNHYHNNTTIVNDNTDNSISNINGTGGMGMASMMHMFTVSWNPGLGYDIMNHTIEFDIDLQVDNNNMSNNSNVSNSMPYSGQWWIEKLTYNYNNQVIQINPTCYEVAFSDFNNRYSGEQYWEEYVANTYGYNSSSSWQLNDVAYDIHHDLVDLSYSDIFYDQCQTSENSITNLFEIDLSIGEVFKLLSAPSGINWDMICDDGYSGHMGVYVGGQSDCTITGSSTSEWDWNYRIVHGDYLGGLNGYHYQPFVSESYSVESQFGIYYEMYPVIVDE